MKAPIVGESVFDYSYHPFECKSFLLRMDKGLHQIATKTIYLYFGIRPILIVISMDTNYNISMEFKLWKLSLAFNLSIWS